MFQPLTQEQYNKAVSAGFSPQQIVEMEKTRKAQETQPTTKRPGLVQSMVQEVVSPFAKMAATGASAIRGAVNLGQAGVAKLQGNEAQFRTQLGQANEPVTLDLGYFGKYNPMGAGESTINQLKEGVGVGAQVGTTVGSFGLGKVTSLGKAVGQGALVGGAYGAGKGLEEKKQGGDVVKQMIFGAATGGAIGGAAYGVQKGLEGVGKKLYQSLERYSNDPKKATQYLIDNEVKQPLSMLDTKLKTDSVVYEDKLQKAFGNYKGPKITETQIRENIWNDYTNSLKYLKREDLIPLLDKEAIVNDAFKSMENVGIKIKIPKDGMAPETWNNLRKMVDNKINDKTFKQMLFENPALQQNLMILRGGIQNTTKTIVPETATIFSEYSPLLAARNGVSNMLTRVNKRAAITATDLIGTFASLFNPSALPYALGYSVGKRAIDQLSPTIAGLSYSLAKGVQTASGPQLQALLLNILTKAER